MFLGESAGAGHISLSSLAHLDIGGDVVAVGDFGIADDLSEVLIFFAGGNDRQVAAFHLGHVEAVEEG